MGALRELFTSDVGLMSLAVIAFILCMGAYYLYYFVHHMHVDEARQRGR